MKKLILNNKCYLSLNDIENYKKDITIINSKKIDIVLFPNIAYLSLFKNFKFKVGSQNFYSSDYGNYTGEVCLESLKDLSISYTILNHSERLINGLDNKSLIKEKLFRSLTAKFNTILVVGEPKYMKEPFQYIKKELNYYLKDIEILNLKNLSIIYEPSWLENDSQDINIIRKVVIDIKEYFIKNYKTDIEVYYGIGVNKNNINDILEVCDGVGIGKKSVDIKYIRDMVDKIN